MKNEKIYVKKGVDVDSLSLFIFPKNVFENAGMKIVKSEKGYKIYNVIGKIKKTSLSYDEEKGYYKDYTEESVEIDLNGKIKIKKYKVWELIERLKYFELTTEDKELKEVARKVIEYAKKNTNKYRKGIALELNEINWDFKTREEINEKMKGNDCFSYVKSGKYKGEPLIYSIKKGKEIIESILYKGHLTTTTKLTETDYIENIDDRIFIKNDISSNYLGNLEYAYNNTYQSGFMNLSPLNLAGYVKGIENINNDEEIKIIQKHECMKNFSEESKDFSLSVFTYGDQDKFDEVLNKAKHFTNNKRIQEIILENSNVIKDDADFSNLKYLEDYDSVKPIDVVSILNYHDDKIITEEERKIIKENTNSLRSLYLSSLFICKRPVKGLVTYLSTGARRNFISHVNFKLTYNHYLSILTYVKENPSNNELKPRYLKYAMDTIMRDETKEYEKRYKKQAKVFFENKDIIVEEITDLSNALWEVQSDVLEYGKRWFKVSKKKNDIVVEYRLRKNPYNVIKSTKNKKELGEYMEKVLG